MWRKSRTRFGRDVLAQEVTAGQMLQAETAGHPLRDGAFPRARRTQDHGSEQLRHFLHALNLPDRVTSAPSNLSLQRMQCIISYFTALFFTKEKRE